MRAPASSANLGPGFDVFGLGLEEPFDVVTVVLLKDQRIVLKLDPKTKYEVPEIWDENSAGLVADALLRNFGRGLGCEIQIRKGIPPGYGLGSSAADAAAVAFALDRLLGLRLSMNTLIAFAAKGEVASAGVPHFDNVAAALLGYFSAIRQGRDRPDLVSLPQPPQDLTLCLGRPLVKVPPKKTGTARSILPKQVPLSDAVWNIASAALITAGFATGNIELIGQGMQDKIVEPIRSNLVPGYDHVKRAALDAGAVGVTISGAGPTMLALIDRGKSEPRKVSRAIREGFRKAGVPCEITITKPGKGVCVVGDDV